MELYIVRHGQSSSNAGFGDPNDPELTDLGIRQAQLLGDALSEIEFDRIIASPLRRSARTACEVALRQHSDIGVELLPELTEVGTVANHRWSFLDECPNEHCILASPMEFPTPLGGDGIHRTETREDTIERARKVISYLRENSREDEKILLAAHGVFNKYLFFAVTGHFFDQYTMLSQDNCCINLCLLYKDEHGNDITKIRYLNRTEHIPPEMRT